MQTTEELCESCKEAERDAKFLISLPVTTSKLRLTVKVCPYCDGQETLRLAYQPR